MYSSINIVIFCLMCKPQLYTCITKLSDMEKKTYIQKHRGAMYFANNII